MYIIKNETGKIIAYTSEPMEGSEYADENDISVIEFKQNQLNQEEKKSKTKSASDTLLKFYAQEILTNPDAPQNVLDAAAELLEE